MRASHHKRYLCILYGHKLTITFIKKPINYYVYRSSVNFNVVYTVYVMYVVSNIQKTQ